MTQPPATFNLQPFTPPAARLLSAQEFIEFAILFGSVARGESGPLSDVDIGIYVSRPLDLLEIGQLTAELECALGRDVDLLVLNDVWKHNLALAHRVVIEGVVLVCRDQEALVDFKTRVFLAYFDTAFLREMVARAFQERLETGQFGKGAEACRRLMRLETHVRELQRFRERYASDDVRQDAHLDWALRYGLFEAIQIVIDISCHVVNRHHLGAPASYAECVELLRRAGYLEEDLAAAVARMVGLRNILVHEYVRVDPERLYELLSRLDDFRRFVEQIRGYV